MLNIYKLLLNYTVSVIRVYIYIRLPSYQVTNTIQVHTIHPIKDIKNTPYNRQNQRNRGNFGNRAFLREQAADLKYF